MPRHASSRRFADDVQDQCRRVLLCLRSDDFALDLARKFYSRMLFPTLAFDLTQTLDCVGADSYRLLVLDHPAAQKETELVRQISDLKQCAVLLVGDVSPEFRSVVDDDAPPGVGVDELFHRAMVLVELSRPVRLPRPLSWGPLELDVGRRTARWEGNAIDLTTPGQREGFDLLRSELLRLSERGVRVEHVSVDEIFKILGRF